MKGIFLIFVMAVFLVTCGQSTIKASQHDEGEILNLTFTRLENDHQAKIGVYALDTESNKEVSYHADDRFAYCSTSKVLMVGAVLRQESLEGIKKTVSYTQKDVLSYAPITSKYVETGMTLEELCVAALRVSDNTAANLLLAHIGGTEGFKMSLRQIGDMVTEPARNEPMLNEAVPEDLRDTSTPHQLAVDFQSYILGDILTSEKKMMLISWMAGNKNTDTLIRAGTPTDWLVADKSGTGGYGTRNDVAIITPPGRKPIILAILTTHNDKELKADDQLVADIAKIVCEQFKK
ncbi:class A beta-lactamase [Anaerosinus gibii]|uniref:Beta-lactamase n=1 Tax=Selenobaculum gibii TaxID=3054208 RepID=A0A9Y2ESS1_9FIRM|nr:class A beta-lactamase [Selenobaculum gbiensis]WIW71268.1 class A beta-lactamase [Selenobaculum gbiensis]